MFFRSARQAIFAPLNRLFPALFQPNPWPKPVQHVRGFKSKRKFNSCLPNYPQNGKLVNETRLSPNLVLRELPQQLVRARYGGQVSRPLVLLFRWLYATPSSLQKYCSLYHDIGLDVLTVRGRPSHFLLPPWGGELASELITFMRDRPPEEQYLVHAFSVGVYHYTIVLQATAADQPKLYEQFRNKIIGQVFDSIVIGNYADVEEDFGQVLPHNKSVRKAVQKVLHSYYNLTHKKYSVQETYENLARHFKEYPIYVPTLFLYAKDDPVCDPNALEEMLAHWKSQSPEFEIQTVPLPSSVHEKAHGHHDEYLAAWTQLMKQLQLVP